MLFKLNAGLYISKLYLVKILKEIKCELKFYMLKD